MWEDEESASTSKLRIKHSIDFGSSWTLKLIVGSPSDSDQPVIKATSDVVNVIWRDDSPGNEEIYTKRSECQCITWMSNKRITNTAGASITLSMGH